MKLKKYLLCDKCPNLVEVTDKDILKCEKCGYEFSKKGKVPRTEKEMRKCFRMIGRGIG